MKGDAKVIDYLNRAIRSELTAVSQYWLHYRLQEDWGLGHMAKKSREESIEEMHHADKLIARVIFLEGHPNLQKLDPLRIGQCTLGANVATELGLGPGESLYSDPTELYDIARPPALKMSVAGVYAPTGSADDDALASAW